MSNEINNIRKLAGLAPLVEHENYDSYVKKLEDDGYTVDVKKSGDSISFNVSKDGNRVTVKEPESGVYKVSGDDKDYSSLSAAVKANCKSKVDESELSEWANSPDNNYDDRGFDRDQAEGEIVDMSLRKHIGGKPMPVRVEESSMTDIITRLNNAILEAEKADKDYDGDGEVESPEEEYKGSKDKAIKKAKTNEASGSKPDFADIDGDGDKEEPMKKAAKDKKKKKVNEGIKNKLKVMALLGLTGLAAHKAMDNFSPKNSPLGQALQQAAEQGDEDAAEHLRQLGAYIDVNSPILRQLNHQYLQEGTTTSAEILESYLAFKG
jgi:hypothetical protein